MKKSLAYAATRIIIPVDVCFRNLNEDTPLGIRRILSQSTDSLGFLARAMSVESLNDDGMLAMLSF